MLARTNADQQNSLPANESSVHPVCGDALVPIVGALETMPIPPLTGYAGTASIEGYGTSILRLRGSAEVHHQVKHWLRCSG